MILNTFNMDAEFLQQFLDRLLFVYVITVEQMNSLFGLWHIFSGAIYFALNVMTGKEPTKFHILASRILNDK